MLPPASLTDIMKRFDLAGFYSLLGRLHTAQTACASIKNVPPAQQNLTLEWFRGIAEDAAKYCHSVGFHHASKKAFTTLANLTATPWIFDASAIEAEFRGLESDIVLEMLKHKFIQIEHPSYLDARELFGPDVARCFPGAAAEMSLAGDCLSVNLSVSAVFHLMRIVEYGLRALAKNLGLHQIIADKKKGKTIPVAFAQWEQVLNQLHPKVDEKIRRIRRGTKKQRAQEFYYAALKDIDGFKLAWRNHVMHSRSAYTSEDAFAILSHVERLMKSLAGYGITELSGSQKVKNVKP